MPDVESDLTWTFVPALLITPVSFTLSYVR
jgi:hypothetical protein